MKIEKSFVALVAITLATILVAPNRATAQTTFDWKSDAPDGNWKQGAEGARWYKQPSGPNYWDQPDNNSNLRFNNNHRLTMTNNVSAGYAVTGLTFGSGNNSSRTIGGNAIGMFDNGGNDPFIVNESTATHTINLAMTTDSNDPLFISLNNSGGLTFGGVITNNNVINLGGSTSTANNTIRFNNVVSGSGGMYVNNGNIIVLMDAANTQTGQLTINAGTVRLNNAGDTFGGSSQAIRVGANATVDLNNVSTTVGSIGEEGNDDGGTVSLGSATLTVGGNSYETFQNSITGTGSLVKNGSGTLNLYGTQSYSGSTTVNAGRLNTSGAMDSTNIVINGGTLGLSGSSNRLSTNTSLAITLAGGTLRLSTNSQTINGTVGLGNNSSSVFSVSGDASGMTINGKISGSGNFSKEGTGILYLAGSNDYSGTSTVTAGILEIRHGSALGSTTGNTAISTNATVKIYTASGGLEVNEAFTISGLGVSENSTDVGALNSTGGNNVLKGNITLGANSRINADTTGAAGSLTIEGNVVGGNNVLFLGAQGGSSGRSGGNMTVAGVISGQGSSQNDTVTSVYKSGSGTLVLAGGNTYEGDTRVSSGQLVVDSAGSLGSGSDVFVASAGSLLLSNSVTVASLQEWSKDNGGTVVVGAGATLTINGANKGTLFQNTISGSGNLTLAASNTVLSLYETGGANTIGGTFAISAGTLGGSTLTAANYALNGGTLNAGLGAGAVTVETGTTTLGSAGRFNSASTLTVNSGQLTLGGNETVASLAGSGGTIALGNSSLTVGGNSYSNSFAGLISGNGSLIKNGTGTLTLSGANTYGGGTLLNGGTLDADNSSAFGTGSVTVAATTTLDLLSHNITNLIINNGGTILSTGTVSDVVASNGTTSIGGADSVVVEASGSATVDVSGSNVTVSNVSGSAAVNVGGTSATIDDVSGGTVTLSNSAAGSTVNTASAGTVNAAAANVNVGTVSGTAAVNVAGTNAQVTTVSGGTVTLSNTATGSRISTASAGTVNANAASVSVGTVSNAATVNVGGANGRVTTLAGGTVNANAAGLVITNKTGGNLAVSNGVSVALRSGSSAGVISGAGGIAKQGSTTLTLSGVNTYTGTTSVEQGRLVVASGGSLASTNTAVTGSTLTVDGTVAGAVTASSGGVVGGSGTVGTLNILSGGVFAPGNSAGTTTATNGASWANGGVYDWEIFDLNGPAGTGWDLLAVTGGSLNLSGITTAGGFTINLITLSSDNSTPGSLTNFDPTASYTGASAWMIASATTVNGFEAGDFTLNSSGFVGATGTFAIEHRSGEGLFITYDGGGSEAIPEPGTWAAAALLAGAAGYVRWRRRKEQPKDA